MVLLVVLATLLAVGGIIYIPFLFDRLRRKRIEVRVCRDIRLAVSSLPPAPPPSS